jgi:hypothetical protein
MFRRRSYRELDPIRDKIIAHAMMREHVSSRMMFR